MPPSDLCTLADARQWCGVSGNTQTDDVLLARLVSAVSRTICGYLSRPLLLPRTITEHYNGNGRTRLMLRHWPVSSIASLAIDGVAIPAATAGVASPNGYLLETWDGAPPGRPQSIDLFGYSFSAGRQNVPVSLVAGYLVSAEAQTIPATPFQLSVNAPYGPWASDFGVSLASTGVAFTGGAVNATPTTGQFAPVADKPGTYQFAAADAGKAVLISYGFVPHDLYQACAELVAERYAYKSRVGQTSKSLGGQETISFSLKDIPDAVRLMLNAYRNVVPL
jgi:hypothetical protein